MRAFLIAGCALSISSAADAGELVLIASVTGGSADSVTSLDVRRVIADLVEHRLDLRLTPLEAPAARAAFESLGKCGSEQSCLLDRLRTARADLGLVISAALDLDLVTISLFDVERGVEIGKGEQDTSARDALAAISALTVGLLDRAGVRPAARLLVDVRPPEALVIIAVAAARSPVRTPSEMTCSSEDVEASVQRGARPKEYALSAEVARRSWTGCIDGRREQVVSERVLKVAPGSYRIRASLAGHHDAEVTIDAVAGADVPVVIELERQTSVLGSPWFWIGAAAAIAGGAIATALATQPANCICFRDGTACDGCR